MAEEATGREALRQAVEAGDVARVTELVAADPVLAGGRSPEGVTWVLHALYRGQRAAAAALLAVRPPLDVFEAAAVGDEARLAEFLEADPNMARTLSPDGFTPLHLAAFFGQPGAAGQLLEAKAPVNAVARNAMAVTPLHSAVAARVPGLVRVLLERGADVNAAQAGGWTALHAVAKQGNEALATLLLEHGADPARPSEDGRLPHELAAEAGHESLAERLQPGS